MVIVSPFVCCKAYSLPAALQMPCTSDQSQPALFNFSNRWVGIRPCTSTRHASTQNLQVAMFSVAEYQTTRRRPDVFKQRRRILSTQNTPLWSMAVWSMADWSSNCCITSDEPLNHDILVKCHCETQWLACVNVCKHPAPSCQSTL